MHIPNESPMPWLVCHSSIILGWEGHLKVEPVKDKMTLSDEVHVI